MIKNDIIYRECKIEVQKLAFLILGAVLDRSVLGFTIDPRTLCPRKVTERNSYAVSVFGTEERLKANTPISQIVGWINRNLQLLTIPKYYVGGWRNGAFVLDVTYTVKGQRAAIAAGYYHDQDAIFDLFNSQEIYLPYPKRRTA